MTLRCLLLYAVNNQRPHLRFVARTRILQLQPPEAWLRIGVPSETGIVTLRQQVFQAVWLVRLLHRSSSKSVRQCEDNLS